MLNKCCNMGGQHCFSVLWQCSCLLQFMDLYILNRTKLAAGMQSFIQHLFLLPEQKKVLPCLKHFIAIQRPRSMRINYYVWFLFPVKSLNSSGLLFFLLWLADYIDLGLVGSLL
jgi:hypothetical protein